MSEKVLIFIDAGFLSKLSKHLGGGEYIKFKIKNLVNNICSKHDFIPEKIFYYTAPPYQSNNPEIKEIQRKEKYDSFRSLLIKEGVIFREGRCQRLKIDNKFEYKQKGVDTLLTIDLSHVKEDYHLIKKIILLSSDTDFCPIIEDIKGRGLEVILFTYFDRKRGSPFSLSNHLLKSCSKWVRLKGEDFK
jgi:uncharacterized LabA/DUF88 family protein